VSRCRALSAKRVRSPSAAVALIVAAGATVLACSLNPQPLPPGETADAAALPTGSTSSSGGSGSSGSSGGQNAGGGADGGADASFGADEGVVGPEAGVLLDATPDGAAAPDGATNDANDADTDAPEGDGAPQAD
jgi:hypothetical protein